MKMFRVPAFLLALDLFFGFPGIASAFYYDPGLGSVVTQGVVGAWLAGIVVLASLREKISDYLKDITNIRK